MKNCSIWYTGSFLEVIQNSQWVILSMHMIAFRRSTNWRTELELRMDCSIKLRLDTKLRLLGGGSVFLVPPCCFEYRVKEDIPFWREKAIELLLSLLAFTFSWVSLSSLRFWNVQMRSRENESWELQSNDSQLPTAVLIAFRHTSAVGILTSW